MTSREGLERHLALFLSLSFSLFVLLLSPSNELVAVIAHWLLPSGETGGEAFFLNQLGLFELSSFSFSLFVLSLSLSNESVAAVAHWLISYGEVNGEGGSLEVRIAKGGEVVREDGLQRR
ncbi:hypothetical protein CRG98_042260 [Punica granatum]|uniref:Uncharacterized protein n=1 Tax=Punica granatum TaxID=22663 RepID=A0A2I0I0S1_PUNGR|nr:hypothetical protein CRG98_042260 [Punica granatum]